MKKNAPAEPALVPQWLGDGPAADPPAEPAPVTDEFGILPAEQPAESNLSQGEYDAIVRDAMLWRTRSVVLSDGGSDVPADPPAEPAPDTLDDWQQERAEYARRTTPANDLCARLIHRADNAATRRNAAMFREAAARIAALESECKVLQACAGGERDAKVAAEVRCKELEPDAARYRWFRDKWLLANCGPTPLIDDYADTPEQIDAQFDAAIGAALAAKP